MKETMRAILDHWGQTVILRQDGAERPIRAILQPSLDRKEQAPDGMTGIGWLDGRRWLYIGQDKVDAGDCLEWNGMTYRVRSGRSYFLGGELLYWWATLEQEAE